MTLASYLWNCYLAYRAARAGEQKRDVYYFAVIRHAVPTLTVIIARDRQAWELSQFIIDHFQMRGDWRRTP